MTKYIGMDVHKTSSTMVVMDQEGKIIQRTTLRTEGEALRTQVAAIAGRKELVFEECGMTPWLVTLLEPAVDNLVVCNPMALRALFRGNKTDLKDAERLAEALRVRAIEPVYHRGHAVAELRFRVRMYFQVTRDLVRHKNRLKGLFRCYGMSPGKELYREGEQEKWVKRLPETGVRRQARFLMEQAEYYEGQKEKVLEEVKTVGRRYTDYRRLQSLPGMGPVHAAVLLAVGVTPHRFRSKKQFWRYCGLAVTRRTSSDWVDGPQGLERRQREQTCGLNGNRHPAMKWVFMQAALVVLSASPFGEYYKECLERGLKASVARVAVARKLAAVTLAVWKQGGRYKPKPSTANPKETKNES